MLMAACLPILLAALCLLTSLVQSQTTCPVTTQRLSEPPYDNFFYSDCNVDAQVVLTSPLPESNLTVIGPRLVIAWPAGNSGEAFFFQPSNGPNGTLAIQLVNSTLGSPLTYYRSNSTGPGPATVGVQGVVSFNASATLAVSILGSVRTIRDFTEGPSLLRPVIQNANRYSRYNDSGVAISRLWLDNVTTSTFTLTPWQSSRNQISLDNTTVTFDAGFYRFQAYFNYPQLQQLTPQQVLNNNSQSLIAQQPSQTTSLSFLSYSEKLLAGAWRFLTYFGRDSMISALLLEPVLSTGNASAYEAVLGAVLERINRTDGTVAHEETLGDYATYLHLLENKTSTDAIFVYPMIDTDFYLPVLMFSYFSKYPERIRPFLLTQAGSVNIANRNLTWGDLALLSAQKIVNITAPFALNQSVQNLLHLKQGEIVGEWRDSTYGLANGRVPFDVNCALVPAALRAIARLATIPGIFPDTSSNVPTLNYSAWPSYAEHHAKIWEENTLPFFEVNLTAQTASSRLTQFTSTSSFYNGPTYNDSLSQYSNSPDGTVTFHALALNGSTELVNDTQAYSQKIPVLHTDTAYHLFLLNVTANSSRAYQQAYTRLINSTSHSILREFPAGLLTPPGLVVANPALSGDPTLIANFTNAAYHGTVIWSWQLALMAEGIHRQLALCSSSANSSSFVPAFCQDRYVHQTLREAYNVLWDNIDDNAAQLQGEVWSWSYNNASDAYTIVPLGSLPPPPGVAGSTESNVRQLWSLTFLAVTRDRAYA